MQRSFGALPAILLLVAASPAIAQDDLGTPAHPLRVGTTEAPPYSWKSASGTRLGIAVELWQQVAASAQFSYEFVDLSPPELVEALSEGKVDIVATALFIGENPEHQWDHSTPFDTPGLHAAMRTKGSSRILAALGQLLQPEVLPWLVLLAVSAALAAWTFHWIERRAPDSHVPRGKRGLFSSLYWSIVTLSTVGYGDVHPRTQRGRWFAVVWILTSMFLLTVVTSSFTSKLTALHLQPEITSLGDLRGSRVGAAHFGPAPALLRAWGIEPIDIETDDQGIQMLLGGEVDAVVGTERALRFVAAGRPGIVILKTQLADEYLALGFRTTLPQPIREKINRAIATLLRTSAWARSLHAPEHGGGG